MSDGAADPRPRTRALPCARWRHACAEVRFRPQVASELPKLCDDRLAESGQCVRRGEVTEPRIDPLDPTLVQNNVMPLNLLAPVNGAPRRIELPAVAVDVPAGQTLYVVASPVSETFAGMGGVARSGWAEGADLAIG